MPAVTPPGILRLVHQAMPAPFRAGLFILHKVHAGAVEQIACGQQRNTGLIQPALLLPGQLIALFVTLGFIQGGGEQEGGRELQGGEKANDTKDAGQQAKLTRDKARRKTTKNLR